MNSSYKSQSSVSRSISGSAESASHGRLKPADFFQKVVTKRSSSQAQNLDLNDETSIEASSLSGELEVHEQVKDMYRKIQSRVLDQVYQKCSPIVNLRGRHSTNQKYNKQLNLTLQAS